jgi:4-hydroxyphenylpyruvate dioxygenase
MSAPQNLGMQVTTFENPMGIDGFEFVEYAAPVGEGGHLHDYFRKLGFTQVARHRTRAISTYRQGDCTFLINEDPDSFAARFAAQHGPSACGFAIRFNKLAEWARVQALKNGAESFEARDELSKAVAAPVIKGIGGCMLYLVDRYDSQGTIHDPDYEWLPGVEKMPKGFGLTFIDHLTHNLYQGNMAKWSDYYERLFNFREIRYFDIKGAKTGLLSKAMTAPDGMVRIPLNESSDPKSQINEYLDTYHGEGIQHIACFTDDIYTTVEAMRAQGVAFLDTPDTYFDVVDLRIPESRRGRAAPACQQDPDRRRSGNQAAQAAADLHPECARPDLLRDHPAQGQRGLRRGQFPGAVREHRTRPDAARRAVTGAIA